MSRQSTFDPGRFIAAQAPVYDTVVAELKAGRKRSHWMWFVFPQIVGLGRSETALFYALHSLDDARAYLAHQVLGTRLRECVEIVMACGITDAHTIFGSPDDLKFRSCLTLFRAVSGEKPFTAALDVFFAGQVDKATIARL